MRLWTLHPRYLDRQGLVALWREALLARAVLRGRTRGYTRHPQLDRFRTHPAPRRAINAYLAAVHGEAAARGYVFDRRKIGPLSVTTPILTTTGQLTHEWQHLVGKLRARSPARLGHLERIGAAGCPDGHPLFAVVPGPVEPWERAYDAARKRGAARADAPSSQGEARGADVPPPTR